MPVVRLPQGICVVNKREWHCRIKWIDIYNLLIIHALVQKADRAFCFAFTHLKMEITNEALVYRDGTVGPKLHQSFLSKFEVLQIQVSLPESQLCRM